MKKFKILLNDVGSIQEFTNKVQTFKSDVDVLSNHYIIDGKSSIGIYTLDLSKPIYVEIISDDLEEVDKFYDTFKKFEVK